MVKKKHVAPKKKGPAARQKRTTKVRHAPARLRFALPPSLGAAQATERAQGFAAELSRLLETPVTVDVVSNYQSLRDALARDEADAIWAPPFVCARLEGTGLQVAVRGVRDGMSAYRAALVCRASERLALDDLEGKRAAWVDPDSVGGHLLAIAMLKEAGLDPWNLFGEQNFVGTYRAALLAVADGTADVASIFAAPTGDIATGLWDVLPERAESFAVVAFSDESPNDGVVVSPKLSRPLRNGLAQALMAMHESATGRELLARTFRVERFEQAPPGCYRSLYRLAVSTS